MSVNITLAHQQLYKLAQIQDFLSPEDPLKFSERHFSHAKYLLSILPKVPNIYPGSNKSLLFSFGNSENCMEFRLYEDASVEMFYKTSKGNYVFQKSTLYEIPNFFKYFFPEEMKNESSAG